MWSRETRRSPVIVKHAKRVEGFSQEKYDSRCERLYMYVIGKKPNDKRRKTLPVPRPDPDADYNLLRL